MQPNFNEFYPTITNLKPSIMEAANFSQNLFEEERNRAQANYRCSLIDIPEINDQHSLLNGIRNPDEIPVGDLFRRPRPSGFNLSSNSLINFDSFYRPSIPVFRPNIVEPQDSTPDLDGSLHLKNLWNSRRNLFEGEAVFQEGMQSLAQQSLRPVLGANSQNVASSLAVSLAKGEACKPIPTVAKAAFARPQARPSVEEPPHKHKIEKMDEKPAQAKKERVACHCKKSKCLRLYCECFAKGLICGVDCACESCHNTEDLKDLRELVVQETLEKNPFAFKSKYKRLKEDTRLLHSRGCNCSKTGCIKKYCECYNAGTGCSRLCKCTNCKNDNIELEDADVKVYYDRVLRKRSKKSVLSECFENKKEIVARMTRD